MAGQQQTTADPEVEPVSKRCQDGLHLWCGALAGRFGQWPCGCSCHDHGRHLDAGRAA
jgi:hypothetical protein